MRLTDRPINCTVEVVRAIRACRQTAIIRPGSSHSMAARAMPGDRLWVREPVHLHRRFEGRAPTVALRDGAIPWYAADGRPSPDYGRRRFARELPRAWHRMHLKLLAVTRIRLHDVDDALPRATGCCGRGGLAQRWDAENAAHDVTFVDAPARWSDNPEVTLIRFDWLDLPLAPPPAPEPQRKVTAEPAPTMPPPAPAPDRTPCPRCGIRADIGCAHRRLAQGARQ